jgi:hypothetical protein
MEIGLYGNRVHCSVSCKTSSKNSNVIKISREDQSGATTIRDDSQQFPLQFHTKRIIVSEEQQFKIRTET